MPLCCLLIAGLLALGPLPPVPRQPLLVARLGVGDADHLVGDGRAVVQDAHDVVLAHGSPALGVRLRGEVLLTRGLDGGLEHRVGDDVHGLHELRHRTVRQGVEPLPLEIGLRRTFGLLPAVVQLLVPGSDNLPGLRDEPNLQDDGDLGTTRHDDLRARVRFGVELPTVGESKVNCQRALGLE